MILGVGFIEKQICCVAVAIQMCATCLEYAKSPNII